MSIVLVFGIFFIGDNIPPNLDALLIILLPWALLHMLFELIRWLIIRFFDFRISLFLIILRWLLFFSIVFYGKDEYVNFGWETYLQINIFCLSIYVLFGFIYILTKINISKFKLRIHKKFLSNTVPFNTYNIAKVAVNYSFIFLFTRFLGLELLGIYQAFKSIANFFGTASQFIDNHVTAFLAREEANIKIDRMIIASMVVVPISIALISYFFKDFVTHLFFSNSYIEFNLIFCIVIYGAVIQVFLRPLVTKIRLDSKFNIFYSSTLIMLFLFCPIMYLAAYENFNLTFILVYEIMPYCVLLASILATKKDKILN